jgi:hypothetical protein
MTKVLQRHSRGCAVAAIAMITGQDYNVLVREMFGSFGKVEGLPLRQVGEQIELKPFDVTLEYEHGFVGDFKAPVADACIVFEVIVFPDSPCAHFVCMAEDGTLFDPMFGAVTWDKYDRQPYARLICRPRSLMREHL